MSIHNPYYIEPRTALTPKQKLQMFIEAGGVCCVCGSVINHVREAWDEHINPLWLDGDNSAPNRAPAHEKCAKHKTGIEAALRSKIRATAEKHYGAKNTKSPPMPGAKRSRFKKHMNGRVSLR